jgi:site-specific recombinase
MRGEVDVAHAAGAELFIDAVFGVEDFADHSRHHNNRWLLAKAASTAGVDTIVDAARWERAPRRCAIIRGMRAISDDPVQALALLPLDQGEETERLWLQNALAWLKREPPRTRTERLRHLAEGLRKLPEVRQRFQQIWGKARPARLLSEAGLPEATSLPREIMARLKRRVIPQLEDELDLYAALHLTDLDDADAEWIAGLSDADISEWCVLLGSSAAHIPAAIRLLAIRAASIGLSRVVMQVLPHRSETDSPFLPLLEGAERFARWSEDAGVGDAFGKDILNCRLAAGVALARLEEQGVSSDLVFRLDLMVAQLERMEALLRLSGGQDYAREFARMLVRGFAEERGIHGLARNNVNRMARQIVTHTGRSGEHYIAASPAEWWRMGFGALGAGGITAFTALFKYVFASMALAPLWVGIAHSLNYTASFVLMQMLGWMLASKMPSMTAAALCNALEKDDGMHAEVSLVAAITRTQTIVTAGNLLGAIPASILIDLLIQWRAGNPFLTQEAALHGLASMHLLRSLTIPFAALTGCFLWISSLAAGWTANWMALNRLPAALAQSRRLRGSLGAEGAVELAQIVEHHFSGIVGYVCLGLLLGLLPFVSVFAGVPVEVRHITLAGASLAYDVSALAWYGLLRWHDVMWALLGLAATGVLNLSVSFALGLWLALRARNLDTRGRRKLVGVLWRELRRHPARFLWRYDEG